MLMKKILSMIPMLGLMLFLVAMNPMVFAGGADGATTATSATTTAKTVTGTTNNITVTTLVSANTSRASMKIINETGTNAFVTIGFNSALQYGKGYTNLTPGASITFDGVAGPVCPQTAVYAIVDSLSNNTVRIIEFNK